MNFRLLGKSSLNFHLRSPKLPRHAGKVLHLDDEVTDVPGLEAFT
jgi:hypothetical protein